MNLSHLAIGLLLLSAACLAGSLFTSRLLGPQQTWSDQDEAEFRQAFSRVHAHGHGEDGKAAGATEANDKERLNELQAKLDSARSRGDTAGTVARGAGVLFGVAGVGIYLANRNKSS